jgi:hypothetical protein
VTASMKPTRILVLAVLLTAAVAPVLHADVKTREKVATKFEGMLGRMAGMFGGSAAKDGITSTVAVKGNRLMRLSDLSGQIIDLDEQKVYTLDPKKKEYRVQTFAELKAHADQARADAEKQMAKMPPDQKAAAAQEPPTSQMTMDVDVKNTGEHKSMLGQDAHETIVTVTMHQQGKTLEDGGGFVITTDEWLVPKVAALDEVAALELRFFQAVYGQAFTLDPQQMAQMNAMFPAFKGLAERAQAEGSKLQGTAVSSITTFESVKSADQMKDAAAQQQQQPADSGGGGVGGMFAKKFAPKPQPVEQRTKTMTSTRDVLSIDTTVSATDLAIPAGWKEKK